jgi:predicted Mrr-cat superfamily restriction endonuclease
MERNSAKGDFNMKYFLFRPLPHGINRTKQFRADNFIAIGWPCMGNLANKELNDLRELLKDNYNIQGHSLGAALSTVKSFVLDMRKGDIVIMPNNEMVYFGRIVSDYIFDVSADNDDDGYSHQREVEWLHEAKRSELPKSLQHALHARRTITNISACTAEVSAVLSPTPLSCEEVASQYPLRNGYTVHIKLPADISKVEAERLGDFIKTIYFK